MAKLKKYLLAICYPSKWISGPEDYNIRRDVFYHYRQRQTFFLLFVMKRGQFPVKCIQSLRILHDGNSNRVDTFAGTRGCIAFSVTRSALF